MILHLLLRTIGAVSLLVWGSFAQAQTGPTTTITVSNTALGFSFCTSEGKPKAYIDIEVLGTVWQKTFVRHEKNHLITKEAVGCDKFEEWNSKGDNRLSSEISAYCASVTAATEPPLSFSRSAAIIDMASRLTHPSYGFGLSLADAQLLLTERCGE